MTQDERERDVATTLKMLLTEIEAAASAAPSEATAPHVAAARRKRVVRAVWDLAGRLLPKQ